MSKSNNALLVSREGQLDTELSLYDVVRFIRRNLSILLSCAVVGCILGLAIAFVLPAEWEARALVRIGQLANIGALGPGNRIEPATHTVEIIKGKSFQDDVLRSLGLSTDADDANAKNFHEELKVKFDKSELISLSLRNTSANEAKLQLSAVVNQLKGIHAKIADPIINSWRQELTSINVTLKNANIESEQLAKSLELQSGSLNVKDLSRSMAVSNVLLARSGQLDGLHERKLQLEDALSPKTTFETDMLGQIEVSEKPVFPKKPLFAVGGLVIGLLLGILWAMLGVIGSKKVV
ncbi:MAG: Wzz/FepE/Etk N-terminal domain-containing protein [Pseudomonadota bacterium]